MLKINGFSLVEVIVVVAILGILAAIAIPSYTKYVTNARRADGKTALTVAAQAMERYFINNYTFENAIIGDNTVNTRYTVQETSDSGYYTLSFSQSTNATAFTIRATAQGKQASDTQCQVMEINQLGQKTPANCW
ncbi:type IV pilin protein [Desulfonatronum sp. SC1]|uniref:type IV pilin protein n=1 Tax=Desulfonatronum sp. SC1 TaxID=2109626 RepID=UPI000D30B019|nr:type IV pilin protein [Desulfonatronum sp. SC1]PTN38142.1 type IV pilin protein [Desulfonatronum sp. SC1]